MHNQWVNQSPVDLIVLIAVWSPSFDKYSWPSATSFSSQSTAWNYVKQINILTDPGVQNQKKKNYFTISKKTNLVIRNLWPLFILYT